MSLSLVLPCFNEALNIEATIADACNWLHDNIDDYELIAVNDGSTDATFEVLERLSKIYPQLVVLSYSPNKGYGEALIAGLDAATKEWLGFMDSDGQFKTADLAELLVYTKEYQFVTGRRSRRADPLIRSVNAFLYGLVVKVALRVFVRDINCGMKLFSAAIWPVIHPRIASGALFNAEVFLRAQGNGIMWKQVAVNHYPRKAGTQTGAKISVILTMFAELFQLKRKYTREKKAMKT